MSFKPSLSNPTLDPFLIARCTNLGSCSGAEVVLFVVASAVHDVPECHTHLDSEFSHDRHSERSRCGLERPSLDVFLFDGVGE